jgi:SAM-dependent methyltransferase
VIHRQLVSLAGATETLRVLDVGCGGGDVVLDLTKLGERSGLQLRVDGCDRSPRAIAFAEQRAARQISTASFFVLDVLRDPLPTAYDFYISSLFLHHLSWSEAADLLNRLATNANAGVIVSDLQRHPAGYLAAFLGTRLLSRSRVVHRDGLLSVRAAMTLLEMEKLAEEAGLAGAHVYRHWPYRIMLAWKKI